MDIFLKLKDGDEIPVEEWLYNEKTKTQHDQTGWVFVGSSFSHDKTCMATQEGNVVNLWSYGNTILDNPDDSGDSDDFYSALTENIPKNEKQITVIMRKK